MKGRPNRFRSGLRIPGHIVHLPVGNHDHTGESLPRDIGHRPGERGEQSGAIIAGTWLRLSRADHAQFEIVLPGEPITLACQVEATGGRLRVRFEGTSAQVETAINVPLCYTEAYTSFGIRCIVAPKVPNNEGSLSVIRVTAPLFDRRLPATTREVTPMGESLSLLVEQSPDRAPR